MNLYYLKYSIDSIGIKSSGTSQSQLTVPDLKKEKILVPPIELQNQFATFVKHIDKLKFDVQKSLEKTQILFDSLMQEYFN